MKLLAIAIVMTLLGGCTARESDDIVKLRLTQEFAKDERTFHECADWARESLGEDASAAEQMELTNSCLHMQGDLQDREADIKEKEKELETAKRELQEARRQVEDAKRKREAERERELEETQRELETERREREAERQRELESARQRELAATRQQAAPRTSEEEMEAARQALEEAKKRELAAAREDLEAARKEREKAQRELEAAKQERESNILRANESPDLADGEEDWGTLHDELQTLIDLDENAKALRLAKKMLRLAEQQENDGRTAVALHNMGRVHFRLENYAKADSFLRRALDMFRAQKYHEAVKIAQGNLANVCNDRGVEYANKDAYSSAEPFFRCALKYALAGWGEDHPTTKLIRENLANTYSEMGQYANAAAVRLGTTANSPASVGAGLLEQWFGATVTTNAQITTNAQTERSQEKWCITLDGEKICEE